MPVEIWTTRLQPNLRRGRSIHLQIRSETVRDYNRIAEVNLLAFREAGEHYERNTFLADFFRHRSGFTPELALVAETDDQIVGYALFSPCQIFLGDSLIPSVFLSPLAVHPAFQNQGIGGRLMTEGHRRAREKGYGLSLLFGDPGYYGRFGYQNKLLSVRGLTIEKQDLPVIAHNVSERPAEPGDIEWLVALWREWHTNDPIALFPGEKLMDWTSHDPQYRCSVVMVDGRRSGYIQYETTSPERLTSFMADSTESATQMLSYLRTKLTSDSLNLGAYPDSPIVSERIDCLYSREVKRSIYGMLKALDEDNPIIKRYIHDALSNEGAARIINLPGPLDL